MNCCLLEGQQATMVHLQFSVINIADMDVVVKEVSGTNQAIDIPKGNVGQVVLTVGSDREALNFNAVPKNGSEPALLINGEKQFSLDPRSADSFKGFVVHKLGKWELSAPLSNPPF